MVTLKIIFSPNHPQPSLYLLIRYHLLFHVLQYNESERLSSKINESSEKLLYAHFLNPCNPLLIGVIKNPFSHKSQDGPEPL